MFDITSTKLLIIGVMALLVVGPKDLPVLLRTVGKYMAIIKRQAAEFRTQADAICADYNAKAATLTDPSSPAEYLTSLKEIVPLQTAQLAKLKELPEVIDARVVQLG